MTTQQPTREQGVPTQAGILRAMARNYAPGNLWDHLDAKAVSKAADELDDLEATVKEREAEIEVLEQQCKVQAETSHHWYGESQVLRQQLAAAQLHNEQLREAVGLAASQFAAKHQWDEAVLCQQALSTQPDLSTLEAERQRVAEACAKVCDELANKTFAYEGADYCQESIRACQWREHLK